MLLAPDSQAFARRASPWLTSVSHKDHRNGLSALSPDLVFAYRRMIFSLEAHGTISGMSAVLHGLANMSTFSLRRGPIIVNMSLRAVSFSASSARLLLSSSYHSMSRSMEVLSPVSARYFCALRIFSKAKFMVLFSRVWYSPVSLSGSTTATLYFVVFIGLTCMNLSFAQEARTRITKRIRIDLKFFIFLLLFQCVLIAFSCDIREPFVSITI